LESLICIVYMCPLCLRNWSLHGYVKNQDITDITILLEVVGNEEELKKVGCHRLVFFFVPYIILQILILFAMYPWVTRHR